MDTFLASYIETALWSSTDDKGIPLDNSEYSDTELAPETLERMRADCESFCAKLTGTTYLEDFDVTQLAHDFWLTRNGHGAGFWDGDYPKELGQKLTDIAHSFGECALYVGDDNKFYIM
jgi:hypothetical protein